MPNELEEAWSEIGNPVRVLAGKKGTIVTGDKANVPTWRQAAMHVDDGANLGITVKAGYLVVDIDGHGADNDPALCEKWGARLRKHGAMRIRNTGRVDDGYSGHWYVALPATYRGVLPNALKGVGELRHSGNNHHVLIPPSSVTASAKHPAGTYEIVENAGSIPVLNEKTLSKLGTVPVSSKSHAASTQPWFVEWLDKVDRFSYLLPDSFVEIVRKRIRRDSHRFAYLPALVNGILRSRDHSEAEKLELLAEAEKLHGVAKATGGASTLASWDAVLTREAERYAELLGMSPEAESERWPSGVPFFDMVAILAVKRRVNREAMLAAVVTAASAGMVPYIASPDGSNEAMPCGLYLILLGKPGSGKSNAAKAAQRFVRKAHGSLSVETSRLGTNQGLHDSFTTKEPVEDSEGKRIGWNWIQDDSKRNKLIFNGEWQDVRKRFNEKGDNNPAPVLRELFFGESLGEDFSKHTSSSAERPNVSGVTVGMLACGHYGDIAEFTSAERGDPQRFLFVEVRRQPEASPEVQAADFPTWQVPSGQRSRWIRCREVTSAKPVRLALNAFEESLSDGVDESEAEMSEHLGAIRLRIAAVLAYLTGDKPRIRMKHWRWAGLLIEERERTLRRLHTAEEERWRRYNVRKGEGQAVQEQARERSILPIEDAVRAVYEAKKAKGKPVTPGVVRNGLPAHRRNETSNAEVKSWLQEWKAEADESA